MVAFQLHNHGQSLLLSLGRRLLLVLSVCTMGTAVPPLAVLYLRGSHQTTLHLVKITG